MNQQYLRNKFKEVYKIQGKTFTSVDKIAAYYGASSYSVAQTWVTKRCVKGIYFIRKVTVKNDEKG